MEDRLMAVKQEKRSKRSLSRRVIRSVAISCAILGLLIQLIGIIHYGVILAREYETVAENAAQQANMSVRHGSGFTVLKEQVMDVYTSFTQEEREAMEPEACRALYAEIVNCPPTGASGLVTPK